MDTSIGHCLILVSIHIYSHYTVGSQMSELLRNIGFKISIMHDTFILLHSERHYLYKINPSNLKQNWHDNVLI
jgi:hypothetical protein